ncbi:MAG TPA: SUF system NifU family Fe-S cluster assembly protein [Verrucomicrobiae bacterium]|nr:SUF system NifU family Fe-S cluster assembly protein [Verrucomicrobiae bacterium]
MFGELQDLYQEVILDHSKSPRNFLKLDVANRIGEGHNPLCGDRVTVYLLLENGIIQEVSFQGEGCAISKASASMMTECLKGKSREEALAVFRKFHEMTTTGTENADELGKLAAFAGVNKFPARVKCATLPWHAIATILEGKQNVVSTE